jgi:hypothetical protein
MDNSLHRITGAWRAHAQQRPSSLPSLATSALARHRPGQRGACPEEDRMLARTTGARKQPAGAADCDGCRVSRTGRPDAICSIQRPGKLHETYQHRACIPYACFVRSKPGRRCPPSSCFMAVILSHRGCGTVARRWQRRRALGATPGYTLAGENRFRPLNAYAASMGAR